MPEISRFFGIIIRMFVNEHGLPHFHAFYQEDQAAIDIESGAVKGRLTPRVMGLVQEWRALHRDELLDCWEKGTKSGIFTKIEPLE